MRKIFTWSIIALMILISIPACGEAATGSASALKTVRVGYFELRNCMEVTKDGTRRFGYTHDVLGEVAAISKWKIEYVDGDFGELLEMLERGEIDVLPSTSYSEERAEKMLFSGFSIAEEGYNIYASLERDQSTLPKTPQDMNGATVATVTGAYQDELLDQWEQENGVSTERVYFDSFEEAWQAIMNGTTEYAVDLDFTAPNNRFVPLFNLGTHGSYFAVAPGRGDLLDDIDRAIERIEQVSPYLFTNLEQEYLKRGISAIQLSDEEYAWLEAHPVIRIGAYTNDYPCSFVDEQGNKVGVYRDLNDMIFDAVGLEIEYEWILYDTIQQAHEDLLSGRLDIFCEDYHDYDIAEKNGLIISDPINEVAMGIMSLAEQGSVPNQKIAVARTRLGEYFTREAYPDSELILCDSVPECVEKVASGEAGYCIAHTSVLHQFSSGYEQTFSMTPLNFLCVVCYTAPKEDPEIISIIDRGLNLISQDERNTMEMRYTSTETSGGYTVTNFVRDHLRLVILIGAILLAVAVIAVNRILYSRRLTADLGEIKRLRDEQQKNEELLTVALDQAQAASRAKTTFLNNMSHDIRTPMNAIIGYTGIAASHIDDRDRVQDCLTKIGQSSNHLLSLINDILDMSRIESGKVSLNEHEESLSDILHTLHDITVSEIKAKRLEFYLDTQDVHDERVICDKLRLNQILLNILSNSIKYTPDGGTIIFKLTEKGVSGSGYAKYEFVIKDNGIGMSPEFLKTIFDPFTRVNSSTISGIQGTGLGMSITRHIVDLMGGVIEIESEEGKGTETRLLLELRIADTEEVTAIRNARLEGLKALVVDDDMAACTGISEMLHSMGMHSDWCVSGKEAVVRTEEAVSRKNPFRVYIIDWQMPDMNGIETARRIRGIVGEDAPIIILSAYDWADIENEAREAGVTDFIAKPIFASDLSRLLGKYFVDDERREASAAAEARFDGRKLLLVEDNEMNREIATEILEEVGFIVDTAENGRIAVDKVGRAAPGDIDLILMDVQMPVMDGYEATRRIRALKNGMEDVLILAMTANAFVEDRALALRAGMNDHLTKPIDIAVLKKTLSKHLAP